MHRRGHLLTVYGVLFVLFLYGPVLLMPVFSVNTSMFATFPLKGITFDNYRDMVGNQSMLSALRNSLVVGVSVAIISTVIGLLAAIALTRYRLPGAGAITAGILLPLVVPLIVFGVAILVILRRVLGIELSLWTIGAAHVLICMPFAMLVLMSRLEGFDKSLEEASRDLGETEWMTFLRVTLPLAVPGVISSLLMSFVTSFDEFVLAFFLSSTETTLPVYLFSQLRFPAKLPAVLALGSTILIVSFVLVVLADWLRRRGTASDRSIGF